MSHDNDAALRAVSERVTSLQEQTLDILEVIRILGASMSPEDGPALKAINSNLLEDVTALYDRLLMLDSDIDDLAHIIKKRENQS
jgi:hypothetical protein